MRKRYVAALCTAAVIVGTYSLSIGADDICQSLDTAYNTETAKGYVLKVAPLELTSVSTSNVRQYYDIQLTEEEQDIIFEVCENFNMDSKLVIAISVVETQCQSDMIGDNGDSMGLMQIQPKWWQHYFDEYGCENWLDIRDNVTVGCAVLQELFEEYGDTRRVLNAYNTGNPDYNNGYADKVIDVMKKLEK